MPQSQYIFHIVSLSFERAQEFGNKIVKALDQIPQTEPHSLETLLSTHKDGRVFYAKWEHSYLALDSNDQFAGVIIGYERKHEDNDLYPTNTLYISSLAVAQQYQRQGLAKQLLTHWIECGMKTGFIALTGPLEFRAQTNSALWNIHVQKLYESVGFTKVGQKEYPNRIDEVYCYTPKSRDLLGPCETSSSLN